MRTVHEDHCTFVIVSRRNLLGVRNISDKSYRENQDMHFMFSNPPPRNCTVYEIMWKNMVEPDRPQITVD